MVPNYYIRNIHTNRAFIVSENELWQCKEIQISEEEFWENYEMNRPDLVVKGRGLSQIIEIDGNFHTNNPKGVKQTLQRNENYRKGGYFVENRTLIILTESDMELNDYDLIEVLRKKFEVQPNEDLQAQLRKKTGSEEGQLN